MAESFIKWVDMADLKNHEGWRVIGKVRTLDGVVRVALAPPSDPATYIDQGESNLGVFYEVDMDELNALSNQGDNETND